MIRRETVEGSHHFMFMDAGDILRASREGSRWMRYQNELWRIDIARFEKQVVLGENSYVERADAMMQRIEQLVPVTRAWRNIDDVVGGLPNVPAFLAGTPQNMRRRVRTMSETAPLAIYMDLASSAGVPAERVLERGITLLALARLLIEHRAVELWVGATLDDRRHSGTAAWRIDTAPLDLARAAFHIADVSMSRLFGYAMCETLTDCHLGGSIDPVTTERRLLLATGWRDILFVPALHLRDPMVSDPVGWIQQQMRKYMHNEEEAA